ncbi:lysylphosphatidylglycerol synthase domain-containing protein [Jatrophihabitans sp. GAS493]|uniref:lysylphosphatidylglycerol synthase domain-containing protein n=1 Tax=Jatrophihabitans sp. GAS493 TaxID=1907575 RepID=UPI0012FE2D3A|nr:lysylphosphatidylglycerol synthase domain-containing protein [Jatrophihabitans sp. GAS493]
MGHVNAAEEPGLGNRGDAADDGPIGGAAAHDGSAQDTTAESAVEGAGAVRGRLDRRRATAGVAVIVVVAIAAGWALFSQRKAFIAGVRVMGYLPLLVSLPVAIVAVFATFLSWNEVLLGLDVRLGFRSAAKVFFVSQLGKYLPGSVWPVALQMQAGYERGAKRRTMLAANLITLVLNCTVGLIIGGLSLSVAQPKVLGHYWWFGFALLILLPLLHPRALPKLIDLLYGLIGKEPLGESVRPASMLRSMGWCALCWFALGIHLAILCAAFGPLSAADIAGCLAAMALAVTLGVLFIPAPAGAGIRDVTLGVVLGSVLANGGQILAVVVASRLVLVVTDLLLALIAAVVPSGAKPTASGSVSQAPGQPTDG